MEVLRQDVEAMEKEMEELRAYLAKTDEKIEPTGIVQLKRMLRTINKTHVVKQK